MIYNVNNPLEPLYWLKHAYECGLRPFPIHGILLDWPRPGMHTCSCWKKTECQEPGKHPATKWREVGPPAWQEIRDWLFRESFGWRLNWAIRTDYSNVIALDVDPRNNGTESLAALVAKYGGKSGTAAIPATPADHVPTRGHHIYFRHPDSVTLPNKKNRTEIAPGIEACYGPGLLHIAPSWHYCGEAYSWDEGRAPWETPFADAPRWLTDLILETEDDKVFRREEKYHQRGIRGGSVGSSASSADSARIQEIISGTPREDILRRAANYAAKCPPAISGHYGHSALFYVTCKLIIGFALSRDEARRILDIYNEQCDPKWANWELEHKLDEAEKEPGVRGYMFIGEGDEGNQHRGHGHSIRTPLTPSERAERRLWGMDIDTTQADAAFHAAKQKSDSRHAEISIANSPTPLAAGTDGASATDADADADAEYTPILTTDREELILRNKQILDEHCREQQRLRANEVYDTASAQLGADGWQLLRQLPRAPKCGIVMNGVCRNDPRKAASYCTRCGTWISFLAGGCDYCRARNMAMHTAHGTLIVKRIYLQRGQAHYWAGPAAEREAKFDAIRAADPRAPSTPTGGGRYICVKQPPIRTLSPDGLRTISLTPAVFILANVPFPGSAPLPDEAAATAALSAAITAIPESPAAAALFSCRKYAPISYARGWEIPRPPPKDSGMDWVKGKGSFDAVKRVLKELGIEYRFRPWNELPDTLDAWINYKIPPRFRTPKGMKILAYWLYEGEIIPVTPFDDDDDESDGNDFSKNENAWDSSPENSYKESFNHSEAIRDSPPTEPAAEPDELDLLHGFAFG